MLLDLLYPRFCVQCGKWRRYLCSSCVRQLEQYLINEMVCPMCEKRAMSGVTHPRCRSTCSLDGLTSFFVYTGVIKTYIKTIKYRRTFDVGRELPQILPTDLVILLAQQTAGYQGLIPLPLHPRRYRERGFNQSEILGKRIAATLHLPFAPQLLSRVVYTKPQVEMTKRSERFANMRQAFIATGTLQGKSVVIFDDVFTTGATLREATRALKLAGACRVWGVTLAR